MKKLRLLVAEDSDNDYHLLRNACASAFEDFESLRVDRIADLERELASTKWDLLVTDYSLPEFSAIDSIRLAKQLSPNRPVIVISGTVGEEVAVQTLQAGARDYLLKDSLVRLPSAIKREVLEAASRQQLEALRKSTNLNEKMASVGRLSGAIAHEINNPLTYTGAVVAQMTDLLHREQEKIAPEVYGELAENLSRLWEGVSRIQKIVRDMQDFLNPRPTESQSLSLSSLVTSVARTLPVDLRQACQLTFKVPEDAYVLGFEGKLQQVLLNLITNASHAMPERSPRENKIDVAAVRKKNAWEVTVTDNGSGIQPDDLQKIFEFGFTTKKAGAGTGFGLAICREILQQHGAEIQVTTKVGEGTSFRFELKSADPAPKSPTLPQSEGEAVPLFRYHVMLVDDEPMILDVLEDMLSDYMDVEKFTTVGAAMDRLRSGGKEFDFVLSDLSMPGKDGMALYEFLKTHKSSLKDKMVFMTGGYYKPDAVEFFQTFDQGRVLAKPFNLQSLMKVIDYARTKI